MNAFVIMHLKLSLRHLLTSIIHIHHFDIKMQWWHHNVLLKIKWDYCHTNSKSWRFILWHLVWDLYVLGGWYNPFLSCGIWYEIYMYLEVGMTHLYCGIWYAIYMYLEVGTTHFYHVTSGMRSICTWRLVWLIYIVAYGMWSICTWRLVPPISIMWHLVWDLYVLGGWYDPFLSCGIKDFGAWPNIIKSKPA